MDTHKLEKPYKCGQCEKSFARKENLTAHERIHAGKQVIECKVRVYYLSCIMRKPDFCLCVNKGADQLCSNCNCTTDQRLPFSLHGSIVQLLFFFYTKFQVSSQLLLLHRPVLV